jgi:hypothetical protein
MKLAFVNSKDYFFIKGAMVIANWIIETLSKSTKIFSERTHRPCIQEACSYSFQVHHPSELLLDTTSADTVSSRSW